ncbi:MAG: HAMP domain-containing sensor histidine kinase [Candidatus Peregrinibacteria bacterium]|nr:HAMP domain-containing sensor histidine kinase [Candidatus Peregrinibacteria bacterium]
MSDLEDKTSEEIVSDDPEELILIANTARQVAEAALAVAEGRILNLRAGIHDANNLLVSVFGYLELATIGVYDPKALKDLGIVADSARKLKVLLNRAITDNSELQLNIDQVDLNGLISAVIISARPFISRGINVNFNQHDHLNVYVDITNLHSSLLNLVKNAAEALDGTVSPEISLRFFEDGDDVKIVVSDNGPGIPVELRSKIFEAHGASTKGNRGHGLGLPMVRKIIEAHGGKILLDSVTADEGENTGTKFTVVLPFSFKE